MNILVIEIDDGDKERELKIDLTGNEVIYFSKDRYRDCDDTSCTERIDIDDIIDFCKDKDSCMKKLVDEACIRREKSGTKIIKDQNKNLRVKNKSLKESLKITNDELESLKKTIKILK